MKCRESSERCFAEVSWLCELCSRGKRPFKVCISSAVYGRLRPYTICFDFDFADLAVFRLLHCLNASAQGTAENFRVFEERHSLCSKKDIPCVRRKAFLVFGEGHSLCSKKDNPCVRRRTFPNRKTCKDSKIARIAPIWTIFVRN